MDDPSCPAACARRTRSRRSCSRCRGSGRRGRGNGAAAPASPRRPSRAPADGSRRTRSCPPGWCMTGAASSSASVAQLVIGLGPVDALPGIDDRPLGRDERVGRRGDRLADRARSGCARPAHSRAVPAISSPSTSQGSSTSTGRGRPLRSWVKARRSTLPTSAGGGQRLGMLGDAAHRAHGVEIVGHVSEAAGIALRQDQHRHRFANRPGRRRHRRSRRPGRAASRTRPSARPRVSRDSASAMCRPVRSWRTMIVRMSASAAASSTGLRG